MRFLNSALEIFEREELCCKLRENGLPLLDAASTVVSLVPWASISSFHSLYSMKGLFVSSTPFYTAHFELTNESSKGNSSSRGILSNASCDVRDDLPLHSYHNERCNQVRF